MGNRTSNAVTIHKYQGLSLSTLLMDIGDSIYLLSAMWPAKAMKLFHRWHLRKDCTSLTSIPVISRVNIQLWRNTIDSVQPTDRTFRSSHLTPRIVSGAYQNSRTKYRSRPLFQHLAIVVRLYHVRRPLPEDSPIRMSFAMTIQLWRWFAPSVFWEPSFILWTPFHPWEVILTSTKPCLSMPP